ncbi:MAG: aminotransferase class I/II-fold pyridoxal phosphate-dependent enzyme [Pseudomonadota bacterium]
MTGPLDPAARVGLKPFLAMDVLREAAKLVADGIDVAHLEIGQPAISAPERVRAAARAALNGDALGYTPALGIEPLRERIAAHYRERDGVEVDPSRIAVTTGSSGGFQLAFLSALQPGGEVILPTPGYPAYPNILTALGFKPRFLPLEARDGWRLTPEALADAITPETTGVVIASPSNPAGTVLPRDQFAEILAVADKAGIHVISDEIYHGLGYGMTPVTALALTDTAIIINSFSKYFCMTGWRVGWMVIPEDLLRPVEMLAQNFFICAPAISQLAAIAAFDAVDEVETAKTEYRDARDLLLSGLSDMGVTSVLPSDGAFYVYADIAHLTNDSVDFCRRLLREHNVAATPGLDFDPDRGNRFIRFSVAGGHTQVEKALERMPAAFRQA